MKRTVWHGTLSNRSLKLVTEGPAIIILMLLEVITPQDLQARTVLEVVKISYSLY